jgi:aryl-alcohol dehydrogenase-like predicted oxidoreductase
MKEIDDSLRRLQTDYIDIYQVHWPDPLVPSEETATAMHELYKQGKIRAIGVSNYSLEHMHLFQQAAPLHTAQPPYNLERDGERDVLPYCRSHAIRWTLDQPFVTMALWGPRHPNQLTPIADFTGWKLDAAALIAINKNVRESITDRSARSS